MPDYCESCALRIFRMTDSIHSPEYRLVLSKLVAMREKVGMTQRDLARELNREHSFVWRFETGKRRLDVVEFYWVCKALRQNAANVYRALSREFTALTTPPSSRQAGKKSRSSRKVRRK